MKDPMDDFPAMVQIVELAKGLHPVSQKWLLSRLSEVEFAQRGWATTPDDDGGRWHYFDRGYSLCERFVVPARELEPDIEESGDDCWKCRDRLLARQGLEEAGFAR